MNPAESARWLDGRRHRDIRVFTSQVDSDMFQVTSETDSGERGAVVFPGWKIMQLAQTFGLKEPVKKRTKWADRRASWVSLCNGDRVPDYPEECRSILSLPERTHVWMYEPKFSDSGIALTDRTGSRPEVGRIVGGDHDGMIVAVRPYAGYWCPGEWGEVRVFGVKDDVEDVLLMEWVERKEYSFSTLRPSMGKSADYLLSQAGPHLSVDIDNMSYARLKTWVPMHDWLVVDRDPLPFQPGKFYRQGTVRMAGPSASAKPGDKCAWRRESETELKGFVLRLEEWGSRTGSFFGPETVLVWDGCAPSWKE